MGDALDVAAATVAVAGPRGTVVVRGGSAGSWGGAGVAVQAAIQGIAISQVWAMAAMGGSTITTLVTARNEAASGNFQRWGLSLPKEPPLRLEIEVIVAWGGRILGVRTLDRRGSFGLRELIGRLPVPSEVLERADARVLRLRDPMVDLVIPRGAAGWIERPGEGRHSLDALQHLGPAFRSAPQRVFPAGSEVLLAPGSTVQLELGSLGLRIACARRGSLAKRFRRSVVDRRLAASCGVAAVTLVGALGASAATVPPLRMAREPLPATTTHRFLIHADLSEVLARSSRVPELAPSPPQALFSEAGEPCRCREAGGTMGCPEALLRSGRYGVQGPQDNPDPHISRSRFQGQSEASMGWPFGTDAPVSDEAPIAPWGRDWSLGTDGISARGNLWGDEIAEANGPSELTNDDVVGGLSKAMVTGERNSRPVGQVGRVVHTGLLLRGALPPSAVLPVVTARFERFSGCYSRELASRPALGGRVEIYFAIEASGAISGVRARWANGSAPDLMSCLAGALDGLSFSPAESSTHVTYPLLLRPQ